MHDMYWANPTILFFVSEYGINELSGRTLLALPLTFWYMKNTIILSKCEFWVQEGQLNQIRADDK